MIRNPSPEFSLLDQALLRCSDGHCLFDNRRRLTSWSVSFADFYPNLAHKIVPGYPYEEFVRDLFTSGALQNVKEIDNMDLWLARHLNTLKNRSGEFVHHLQDGRFILIRHTNLTNDHWFFGAHDITTLMLQKEAVQLSKRKFERFAKLASDWFWELDCNLCYLYYSSHNQPIGNLNPQQIVGMSRIDHVTDHATDDSQLREHNKALQEHREVDTTLTWRRPDNPSEFIHAHVTATPQFNDDGKFTGYLGCVRNITTEYGLKTQLEYQAAYDELTGLINRRAFSNYLRISLDNKTLSSVTSQLTGRLHNTLIFVDIDQFKIVNDNAGHLAGDRLLTDIASLFAKVFAHPDDIIARLGGDEFAVLSACDTNEAKEKSEELIQLIGQYRLHWDERSFSVGASAGIVQLDCSSTNDSDILSKADSACYSAKMSGRNQAHVYNGQSTFENSQIDEISKLALINDVLMNGQLSLYLQPIVPTSYTSADDAPVIRSHEHLKYEVLLRIWNSDGNPVPPGELIPVAEKYDRMQHLDLWVVEKAIFGLKEFHAADVPVLLSVNLSGNTLSNDSCLKRIIALVEHHKIDAKSLCFEITETAAIKDVERVCRFIGQLKALGCKFSLDDFGSGLSSFSYLRSLKVDYLKIDGCFVTNIVEDPANQAIVSSFNILAHQLGMKTVAEYVENSQIANMLTDLGVDYLQGFEFGRPQDMQELLEFHAEPQKLTSS